MRILLLLSLVTFCSCAQPDLPDRENSTDALQDTIRILAIGNSFSSDAVEQYLWELFHAAGIPAVVGNMSVPGSYLSLHWDRYLSGASEYRYFKRTDKGAFAWEGKTFRECVGDEKWTYISLQQASHDSGIRSSYEPWLSMLIDTVRAYQPDARLCWMQTWAYSRDARHPAYPRYHNDQQEMWDSIQSCMKSQIINHKLQIIPCGQAIQNARATRLGDTLCRDGYHLNYEYGRYTAACVWYEILTGLDVRRNPY